MDNTFSPLLARISRCLGFNTLGCQTTIIDMTAIVRNNSGEHQRNLPVRSEALDDRSSTDVLVLAVREFEEIDPRDLSFRQAVTFNPDRG